MALSLDDIVGSIPVEGKTELDIWNKLKHYLSEYWDGEKNIFDQVVILSGKQLDRQGRAIESTAAYFEVLESNFSDRNDLLEFLINLTDYLNYYSEDGSVKVAEKLKELRNNLSKLRRHCLERGIFRDKCFVGRENEIFLMKNSIETGEKQGIFVCGLGGMGKTSLTRAVCYDLRSDRWKTVKIELREQRTFVHFLRTSILSIKDLRGSGTEGINAAISTDDTVDMNEIVHKEDGLQQLLLEFFESRVNKQRRKLIFFFDNIDDIEDVIEKQKVLSFFQTILVTLNGSTNTRIIVTCREDVLGVPGDNLTELMVKIEVKRLLHVDAEALVRECTRKVDITTKDIKRIITECGACPLAIRVICDVINDCRYEDLSFLKKRPDEVISSSLNITKVDWLLQPFERLSFEEKCLICMLSLFGTSKFDLKFADFIINGKSIKCEKDEIYERRRSSSLHRNQSFEKHQCNCPSCKKVLERSVDLKFKLLSLKRRHLLEIDNDVFDQIDPDETAQESLLAGECSFIYSIHPLVCKFLSERARGENTKNAMEKAKNNYFALFDDLVLEIGSCYDSSVLVAREKADYLRNYIQKYISIMSEVGKHDNQYNQDILRRLSLTTTEDEIKRRNNVVQMILNPEHHLLFIKAMSGTSKKGSLSKLSWEVECVAACIRYDKQDVDVDSKISELEKSFPSIDTSGFTNTEQTQFAILYARIKYYKGLRLMDSSSDSRETFKEASELFSSDKLKHSSTSIIYQADIYNCIGCLEYREHHPDEAIKKHKLAVSLLSKKFKNNENIPMYYANIASCHFKKGIQHFLDKQTDKVKIEMEKALKSYNECIQNAYCQKLGNTLLYVRKLKNRADVQTMLHKFDAAKKDYDESLKTLKRLFQMPTRTEILILHARGEMIRKMIPLCKTGDIDKDVYDLVDDGIDIYEQIRDIINPVIFPSDHAAFNKIRKNHLYFMEQRRETDMKKDTEKFYARYHDQNWKSGSSSSSSSGSSVSDVSVDELTAIESTIDTQSNHKDSFKTFLPQNLLSCQGKDTFEDRKSSSGVSSMGSSASDHDSCSLTRKLSVLSGHSSSFEDEVFVRRASVDDRSEKRLDQGWTARKSTFASFGSSTLESSRDDDVDGNGQGRKRKTDDNNYQKEPPNKIKSLNWILPDKLSSRLEDKTEERSTQTEITQIDKLLQNDRKMQLLVNAVTSGNAKLVEDRSGRPIVQYRQSDCLEHLKDEGSEN